MTIENENTQIKFVNPEVDAGKMVKVVQTIYDALLEMDSLKEIIKGAVDSGYEDYKARISEDAKKGDYSSFVKGLAQEMFDNAISEKVEKMENVLDYVEVCKNNMKK